MPISSEVRRLSAKWQTNAGWPKRLDWLEIGGLRGWTGQRFNFTFPMMAVVGENGVGKSTVLQCAAAVYRSSNSKKRGRFASDFFPDTAWEQIENATIRYAVRENHNPYTGSIRKPGERWRGNPERRERPVEYIDLSRIQPISMRTGYPKLAKAQFKEVSASDFDKYRLGRLSQIMGRSYDLARMALTDADRKRLVPVISQNEDLYSGFHQGAGETTITELIQAHLPKYGIVLIDEIESSLHPRSQRRLIRDLAVQCKDRELQIILTTHSPYVLDELPLEARAYIIQSSSAERKIIYGVSPEFAMTKMDDQPHYECDLYVEDERAEALLLEILAAHDKTLVQKCQTIPYGASSVGQSLGIMASQKRFPRPSCVFVDGDQGQVPGCINLPGEDPPERVVFEALKAKAWGKMAARTGRAFADFDDACTQAMALNDHHEWVRHAATELVLGGTVLWQALCAEWATTCLPGEEANKIVQAIEDALIGQPPSIAPQIKHAMPIPVVPAPRVSVPPIETLPLFAQSPDVDSD